MHAVWIFFFGLPLGMYIRCLLPTSITISSSTQFFVFRNFFPEGFQLSNDGLILILFIRDLRLNWYIFAYCYGQNKTLNSFVVSHSHSNKMFDELEHIYTIAVLVVTLFKQYVGKMEWSQEWVIQKEKKRKDQTQSKFISANNIWLSQTNRRIASSWNLNDFTQHFFILFIFINWWNGTPQKRIKWSHQPVDMYTYNLYSIYA